MGLSNLEALNVSGNFLLLNAGSSALAVIESLQNGGTSVIFEPQNLDIFQGQPIDGFVGWRASQWYLNYNVDFWPWIYHDEHGWQFVSENSSEDIILLFDLGLEEWIFLNANTYRWFFLFSNTPGWIWTFGGNTPIRRWFQGRDDGSLFLVTPGL